MIITGASGGQPEGEAEAAHGHTRGRRQFQADRATSAKPRGMTKHSESADPELLWVEEQGAAVDSGSKGRGLLKACKAGQGPSPLHHRTPEPQAAATREKGGSAPAQRLGETLASSPRQESHT